jgi:hypothetical protein
VTGGAAWPLLGFIISDRTIAIVMAVGLVGVFALLAALIWTRFGQAKPVSKCVVLSLLAHALFLIYAYSTQVLFGPPGKWTGQIVTVRLRDAADDQETARTTTSAPQPWEQAGADNVPLQEAFPENRATPKPAEPKRSLANVAPPDLLQPRPAELAITRPPAPPLAAPSPPPLLPDKPANPTPPEKVAAAPAPPTEGTPETPSPAATMPNLTDLLPEDNQASSTTPNEVAAMPPNPLREPGGEEAALPTETAPPAPDAQAGQEFTAAASGVPRRLGDGREVPESLRARVAADRLRAAQPFGASPRTEAAVAAALDWLASVQSDDGRWDADAFGAGRETRTLGHDRRGAGAQADTGVSGLALLTFLGNGETHLEGRHRETVQHGLEFLLASQAANGSLAGNAEFFASMYCHGIATLALSEAYALSGDERLLPALKRALQYTIEAQHHGGGWRYQPYDAGDMSQFGWQLMALKSAELGGIPIPAGTRSRMATFLRSCSSGKNRGLASYRPGDRVSRTMTAEALVCRYFLEAENSPSQSAEASTYLLEERPGEGQANYYYWYYGTVAMFQRQGEDWTRWNAALQNELLHRQRWDGGVVGSWDPDDQWGGYGGRIYSTSLAALSLEVYYRYLPLHVQQSVQDRLTDRPFNGLPR